MDLEAFYYDAEGRDRKIALDDISLVELDENNLLWIDVARPERADLDKVASLLKVPRELFDSDKVHSRPQLDNYGEFFRFSVDTAPVHHADVPSRKPVLIETDTGHREVTGSVRIDFIVAQRWLITIHDGDVPCLLRFREQDKADTVIGRLTGQALAASLLDWHLGEYFQEVSRIEAAVDKLDERVLRESSNKTLLGRMVALRRRVSKLRGLLVAQRDIFYGLSRPDFALITDSGASPFYDALVGRFERAVDEVEHSRDVVVGSFELFTSRTSQQTNELVKVLTFLTAIVGFCAAVAGLMGMNFKLAFFETGLTGFAIVTGALIIIALAAMAYARSREWI